VNNTSEINNDILSRLRDRDKQAFSIVFEMYYRMLYALAFRYLKSEDAAMDAVQNTFMKLWEICDTLRVDTNLKSIIFTIIKNDILNSLRDDKKHIEKLLILAQHKERDTVLDNIDNANIREQLYASIDKLPSQQRTICLLKLKENLTNMEIAERLNLALPTVKVHYNKAIKNLRNMLGDDFFIITLILLSASSVFKMNIWI
jgi:RNA polymerase sigma-70 factor (ECF subfamily)